MKLIKNARPLTTTTCSLVFFTSSALAGGGIDILIEGNESPQDLTGLEGVPAPKMLNAVSPSKTPARYGGKYFLICHVVLGSLVARCRGINFGE